MSLLQGVLYTHLGLGGMSLLQGTHLGLGSMSLLQDVLHYKFPCITKQLLSYMDPARNLNTQ